MMIDPDDFDGRYAMCPLCRRDNVTLSRVLPGIDEVVFDEHTIPIPVVAHPEPVDPGSRFNPRAMEATYAQARCPVSGARLMERLT